MRIFAAATLNAEPVAHTFKFTQKNGTRQEMDTFVAALQAAVAAKKAATQKVVNKPTVSEILASQDVESDTVLQESLLKSNPELAGTFKEAVINGSVTPTQFWSSRTHLLRAFLVEKSQQKGPYNVLSTIRPKTVDNKITVNMTREKIRDVFQQHKILRRVYDDLVPPLSEDEFWSRFFVSRLCKRLRGERILQSDPIDDKLDKYVSEPDPAHNQDEEFANVAQVIDLQGNEAHNSKKMGNAPDFTMRPSRTEVVNSINSISLKMLDSLGRTNEENYYRNEIRLTDLQRDEDDVRVPLTVRESTFTERVVPQQTASDPARTVEMIRLAVPEQLALHVDDTDDTFKRINEEVQARVADSSSHTFTGNTLTQLQMSHGATQEFLSLFWTYFLSGEQSNAKALSKMSESLRRTSERVESIAKSAGAGDREHVMAVMQPTLRAVDAALRAYQTELTRDQSQLRQ